MECIDFGEFLPRAMHQSKHHYNRIGNYSGSGWSGYKGYSVKRHSQ